MRHMESLLLHILIIPVLRIYAIILLLKLLSSQIKNWEAVLKDTDRLDRLQRELLMQLRHTNCSLIDLVKSKIDLKKKELK
ncbi:hypothetical protein ES703_119052 [subsurface metagenome]